MKNQLLNLAYLRRKERKSLFFVIALLLLSSFLDEFYQIMTSDSQENLNSIDFIENRSQSHKSTRSNDTYVTYNAELPSKKEKSSKKAENHAVLTIKNKNQKSYKKQAKSFEEQVINREFEQKEELVTIEKPESPVLDTAVLADYLESIVVQVNSPMIEDLIKLGISKKAAWNWKKYTDAGGKFYTPDDLKKIYGLEAEQIHLIAERLEFPEKSLSVFNRKLQALQINTATAEEFAKISGLGPVLSERIVKFRGKLGGFYSYEQLIEVYGIEASVIEAHKDLFLLDDPYISLNINTIDAETLGAHSYCSFRTAKAIANYRLQHGNFTSLQDLLKIRIIDQAWIDKIGPYLTF